MTPSEERDAVDRGDFLPFFIELRKVRQERDEARAAARWYHHGATSEKQAWAAETWRWLEDEK
jgi:hypothetical protein